MKLQLRPGAIARRLLGDRFQPVGELYRSVFVDLDLVAETIATHLPENAHVLEIGAGDGALANALLRRRADLRFTLIDLASEVGGFLRPDQRERTVIRAATPMTELTTESFSCDALLLADVLHHVAVDERDLFFAELGALRRVSEARVVVIKDIAPGHWRATLSRLADKYITGDRQVSLIGPDEMARRATRGLGRPPLGSAELPDAPNYLLAWRFDAEPSPGP